MDEKLIIKETIVVEGKDDRSAVLASLSANIICTSGWGLNDKILADINDAYEKTGIIIFTDPDHAGRKIREKLLAQFPNAKQAFLTKSESTKKGDIGIENAKPQDIRKAILASASAGENNLSFDITMDDLKDLGLAGSTDSTSKREAVGKILGIGYANSKTFLKRLEFFGISKDKLIESCRQN